MNKLNKRIGSLALSCMAIFTTGALASCGGKGGGNKPTDSPTSLDVYIYNAGYGYKWCEDILSAFKEEPWVKEKYPNIKTSFAQDALINTASTNISSKDTEYDVIFGVNFNGYCNEEYTLDLTETVFNKTVPGENITYKDKMKESTMLSLVADNGHFYSSSWANTMTGIVYNEDILNELGFDVPLTTNELIAISDSIYTGEYSKNAPYLNEVKSGKIDSSIYSNKQAFITYGVSPYTNYTLSTWWAQYEGEEGYDNFFRGMTDRGVSVEALKQTGRLKSLEVLEEIHKKRNGTDGYTSLQEGVGREAFRKAQNNVVLGKSLFMCNGDWFDNEMRDFTDEARDNGIKVGTVKLMKSPIISSITEKLETVKEDKLLSLVVEAIDKKCNTVEEAKDKGINLEGVSNEDFEIVKTARNVMYSLGGGHSLAIPKNSPATEIASDFLLYLATDKCLETYIRETKGNSLPFNYDIMEKNPDLYNTLSPMGKQCLDMATDPSTRVLKDISKLPLVNKGGLMAYKSISDKAGMYMYSEGRTALDIYEQDYKYWTTANRWQNACQNAGI